MNLITLYKTLSKRSGFVLERLLEARHKKGKEIGARLSEKKGIYTRSRPDGKLLWLHAASVGELQSALVLIDVLLDVYKDLHVLVTSGTKTSAELAEKRLPERAFHQFCPLDHPVWVRAFLDHWRPDAVLWMESELWPNMLLNIKKRAIPSVLLNARMSPSSYRFWRWFPRSIERFLSCFSCVLAQNEVAATYYRDLAQVPVHLPGNLKYSAEPLSHNLPDLRALRAVIAARPVWLYASSHRGEEALACKTHRRLQNTFPDLITIIVPRHPERGAEIMGVCEQYGLDSQRRSIHKKLPDVDTDIYIADTLGEMGLFYELAPIACIGRSFSDDGGGGHNPIEPAQLKCAVLSGPYVQNFTDVYADMWHAEAAVKVHTQDQLCGALELYLKDTGALAELAEAGYIFARQQKGALEAVLGYLHPIMDEALADGAAMKGRG